MPWWQRQTFLEGLEEEGIIGDEEGNAVNPDYSSKPGSESKINDLSGAASGSFAALGFRETTI